MPRVTVREADLNGADAAVAGALIRAYLVQTESEKLAHLGRGALVLSDAHEREAADLSGAYTDSAVLLAEVDGVPSASARRRVN
jgi:hypothetical protein